MITLKNDETEFRPQNSRFFKRNEFPRLQNSRELIDLVVPDFGTFSNFVRKIGLSDSPEVLRPIFSNEGALRAFLKLGIGEALALPPERWSEYFRDSPATDVSTLGDLIALQMHLKMNIESSDSNTDVTGDAKYRFAFPVRFAVSQTEYHDHSLYQLVSANVFGMYLRGEHAAEVYRYLPPDVNEHVENAFAFVRFHMNSGRIIVSDIQSDYYRYLPVGVKERYSNWAQVLLSRLESGLVNYASGLKIDEKNSSLTLYLPDSELMRKRWPTFSNTHSDGSPPTVAHGISSGLAHYVYEKVPKELGYKKIPWPAEFAFPEKNPQEKEVKSKAIWVKEICGDAALDLSTINRQRPSQLTAFLSKLLPHDAIEAEEFGVSLSLSADSAIVVNGADLQSNLKPFFHFAPSEVLAPLSITGVSEHQLALRNELLSGDAIQTVLDALPPDFCPISCGAKSGIPNDWWNIFEPHSPGWHLSPIHLPDQNRHPSIRFIRYDDEGKPIDGICVTFKGAGAHSSSQKDLMWVGPFSLGKDESDANPSLATHAVWGGMSDAEGKAEFVNTLGIIHLTRETGAIKDASITIPLDLVRFVTIPHTLSGRPGWTSQGEYWRNIVHAKSMKAQFSLYCARSLTRSDVRLSQVVNRVFGRDRNSESSPQEIKHEIDSSLRYLYWIHGRDFVPPPFLPTPNNATIGPAEIAHYLSGVYQFNSASARYIRTVLIQNTLKVIASVHGAGGHLGGIRVGEVGAWNGGSPAIRNVSVDGSLKDFDGELYLPWIHSDSLRIDGHIRHRELRTSFQASDLFMWRDTAYWINTLLLGRNVAPGTPLKEHRVFDSVSIYRFGNVAQTSVRTKIGRPRACTTLPIQLTAVGADRELRDLYRKFYNSGRAFLETRGDKFLL